MRLKAKNKQAQNTESNSVAHTSIKGAWHKPILKLIFILVATLALTGATIYFLFDKKASKNDTNSLSPASQAAIEANRYNLEGNQSEALKHARRALALAPDDLDTIQAVIVLIENDNPEEAKKLYQHAFEVFKKIENPDKEGLPILTYMAAANFAKKSGYDELAKKYYKFAIDVADLSNSEHQILVKQAQTALESTQ